MPVVFIAFCQVFGLLSLFIKIETEFGNTFFNFKKIIIIYIYIYIHFFFFFLYIYCESYYAW